MIIHKFITNLIQLVGFIGLRFMKLGNQALTQFTGASLDKRHAIYLDLYAC